MMVIIADSHTLLGGRRRAVKAGSCSGSATRIALADLKARSGALFEREQLRSADGQAIQSTTAWYSRSDHGRHG